MYMSLGSDIKMYNKKESFGRYEQRSAKGNNMASEIH